MQLAFQPALRSLQSRGETLIFTDERREWALLCLVKFPLLTPSLPSEHVTFREDTNLDSVDNLFTSASKLSMSFQLSPIASILMGLHD